jgi:hypothetical protein
MTFDEPMTFDEWLKYGVDNGFCSEQRCDTHEGIPMTETETELFENGNDPCVHVVRLGTPDRWEQDALAYQESV